MEHFKSIQRRCHEGWFWDNAFEKEAKTFLVNSNTTIKVL